MARRRRIECFTVDVDGEPVLVRGDAGMDAEARAALAEVIRAARAELAERRGRAGDG